MKMPDDIETEGKRLNVLKALWQARPKGMRFVKLRIKAGLTSNEQTSAVIEWLGERGYVSSDGAGKWHISEEGRRWFEGHPFVQITQPHDRPPE